MARAPAQRKAAPRAAAKTSPWTQPNWGGKARLVGQLLWRAVEAQHHVATMSLVDNREEQHLLEQMLETSKPPLPAQANPKADYLLTTPFRYSSPYPSRFRAANDKGVWYGAEDLPTACAEVGYWRWRFLVDSDGLRDKELRTELTLFQARVRGRCIDLTESPWNQFQNQWGDLSDYSHCHALAAHARTTSVSWIRYLSARHPNGRCGAVFDPGALDRPHPARLQTWRCRITATSIHFTHDKNWLTFEPTAQGVTATQ